MDYNKGKKISWISAISILIAGIIHLWMPGTAKEFYLNILGKFYIIDNMQLTAFLCFINVMLGSGYFLLSNQGYNSPKLFTGIHVILTVLCSAIVWLAGFMLNKNVFTDIQLYSQIFGIALCALIAVQLIYFVSLLRLLSK